MRTKIPFTKGLYCGTFDVSFDVSLNKLLNKWSSNWWFEMPWCSWQHCNENWFSASAKVAHKQFISLCLYFDGLVQGCSNSIANALELLQSCTKPSIWSCLPPQEWPGVVPSRSRQSPDGAQLPWQTARRDVRRGHSVPVAVWAQGSGLLVWLC